MYFANSPATVFRESAIWEFLTFHVPKSHIYFPFAQSLTKIRASHRPSVTFRNKLDFYGEELSVPLPIPKLEDRPMLAVRDCLFSILAATLHNWTRHAMGHRKMAEWHR